MLLFLPGLICDARIYAPQTAAFPQSHAFNGYGMVDDLQEMARIVLEQADDRFDLFGHSMGGRVALEVYRQAPERVRRLALSSTGVHPVKPGEADKRAALQQVGYDNGFEALVDQWLPPMVAPENQLKADLYAPMKEMCLSHGQDLFDAQVRALLGRPAVADLLPTITCPTLVVTGELDQWAPPSQHAEFAEQIPNSKLVIVPGAGHMLPLEAPEALNSAIASWLEMPAND